ncbi:exonuclease [Yersinia phage vB_YenM_P778]
MTNNFICTKLPDSVTHAFIDSDTIAYEAAFAVEKSRYQYTNTETLEKTVTFASAADGKQWLKQQAETAEILCVEFNPDVWARETIKVLGTEEEAVKASDHALKGWLKHVKGLEWKGYFTERDVLKSKDIKGLEKRYQGNREKVRSPKFLVPCREHLLSKPEFSMVKGGFEADAIVIAKAEKGGKTACLMSLDKDLRQAENTYVIDRSYEPPMILIADNNAGGVWECPIKSKPAKKEYKYTGVGAKWLCFQAVAGDNADGYGGVKGVGAKAVLQVLAPCVTHKDCAEAIYKEFYEPRGVFKYESWDGQLMELSPAEMMEQHFNLAYQERSPTDCWTFDKWGMERPSASNGEVL